jgi:hypothetical protein
MTSRTLQLALASVFALLLLIVTSEAQISSTTCLDISSDGANITHIFIDAGCTGSPSDFAITVDGEPIEHLSTDDGPCESIPRDVWFALHAPQDTAHVCVSVQGDCSGPIQVYAKAGSVCIAATLPSQQ